MWRLQGAFDVDYRKQLARAVCTDEVIIYLTQGKNKGTLFLWKGHLNSLLRVAFFGIVVLASLLP